MLFSHTLPSFSLPLGSRTDCQNPHLFLIPLYGIHHEFFATDSIQPFQLNHHDGDHFIWRHPWILREGLVFIGKGYRLGIIWICSHGPVLFPAAHCQVRVSDGRDQELSVPKLNRIGMLWNLVSRSVSHEPEVQNFQPVLIAREANVSRAFSMRW